MMASLIIHGHFYQPPRENPWTGKLDREESAHPFHDWNERIYAECYRPNAYARVLDSRGRITRIVNNYSNINFNFGPTLLSWIERHHPYTYARILEADRESRRLRHGHGNAIAQGYNHAILPLCNARDRRTQILWGIADFRHRFGREPEALWLPETACNDVTLCELIEAGMRYVILSPYQAERIRPLAGGEWQNVSDGSVDPRRPYRYFHRDGSGRSIAIFFYDGPASQAISFEGALWSSQNLVDRLIRALGNDGQLVHVATDGETYGHHFHFGDRCLAYALEYEAAARGLTVTNYGEYLEAHPPEYEAEIKPGPNGEGTAWSCAHGVGRWYRDCGCSTGGREGWNQAWRGPLRAALDLLRDHAAAIFETAGGDLFADPWAARDAYIELLLDGGRNRDEFLSRFANRRLSESEQLRALTLLEMQRNAMLMYTSCGWFFADISGIETVQVMKYAGRLMDLLDELDADVPLESFLERLAEAKSNLPEMGNGADVYRRFVNPCRVSPRRIAAHLSITSLAGNDADAGDIGAYHFEKQAWEIQRDGRLTLALGRLTVSALTTGRKDDFAVAAMHLGQMDFYCALRQYPGASRFRRAGEKLRRIFQSASLPAILRAMQDEFGPDEHGLEDVLPEGRSVIAQLVFGSLLEDFTEQFSRLYEDCRRIVERLRRAGFDLPPELRQVTEVALTKRLEEALRSHEGLFVAEDYEEAVRIAEELHRLNSRFDRSACNAIISERIAQSVELAVSDPSPENVNSAKSFVELARTLQLEPNLDRPQELVYAALSEGAPGSDFLVPLASALGLVPTALAKSGHSGFEKPPVQGGRAETERSAERPS